MTNMEEKDIKKDTDQEDSDELDLGKDSNGLLDYDGQPYVYNYTYNYTYDYDREPEPKLVQKKTMRTISDWKLLFEIDDTLDKLKRDVAYLLQKETQHKTQYRGSQTLMTIKEYLYFEKDKLSGIIPEEEKLRRLSEYLESVEQEEKEEKNQINE
jgi:hypothetical protein